LKARRRNPTSKKKQDVSGIYSLDGNKLNICLIHKGAVPKEFKISADSEGIILELKREKR
jgi:hypothetical protein